MTHTAIRVFLGLSLVTAATCLGQNQTHDVSNSAPGSKTNPYQQPKESLDKRIKADKITQFDPPPLPERVVLPKPPENRISQDPSEVPISTELWTKANQSIKNGLTFLRAHQDSSGGWMKDTKAAPTDQADRPSPVTLAVTALGIR